MIFSKEELRDQNTDVVSVLKTKSNEDIYSAVLEKDKYQMMMIHRFLKHRSSEEFRYLLSRLSNYYLEQILSAYFTVTFKSKETGSTKRRITGWHYLFAYQSLNNILYILKRINSHGLFHTFQAEEVVEENKKVLWSTMLQLNNDIPTEKKKNLLDGINEFVHIMSVCRTISSDEPQVFPEQFSKIALLLGMNFQDNRTNFKRWGLLHFVAFATQQESEHKAHYASLASKIIRNLSTPLLNRIKDIKCGNTDHLDCNLLHYMLLYITSQDDIQTLCAKAGVEITNQWLSERMRSHKLYDGKGMRNWSALQMMLIYFSRPSLKAILFYATPKTLFFALRTDVAENFQSDNTLSFHNLIKQNKSLETGTGPKSFKYEAEKIEGIYLFYELYNYFDVIGRRYDMSTRIACVNNLIRFLENPPEEYCFGTKLVENCYMDIKEFTGIKVLRYFGVRKFNDILSDICFSKSSKLVEAGYAACREMYVKKFAPELIRVVEDDEEDHQHSSKKVKIMS